MDFAARGGHLEVVQFLQQHRIEGASQRAMDMAAQEGHEHVVRWLFANRSDGCTRLAFDCAAGNGHLTIAQFLAANYDIGFSAAAVELAARGGHLDVLTWLLQYNPQLFADALGRSIAPTVPPGQAIRFVIVNAAHYSNGTDTKSEAIDLAIRYGHVAVAAWLLTQGFQPSRSAFDWAARNGELEMLIWLHEKVHLSPTKYAVDWAVMSDHIHVIDWMLHAGITSKETVWRYAKLHGRNYMLEWLSNWQD